jgi:hypothetical protein
LPKRFTEPDGNTAAAPAATPAPIMTNPALLIAAPMGQDWPGRDLLDTPMLARVLLVSRDRHAHPTNSPKSV